jgi:hypothetical protein
MSHMVRIRRWKFFKTAPRRETHSPGGSDPSLRSSNNMKIFLPLAALVSVLFLGAETASAGSPAACDNYARNYANNAAAGKAVASTVIGGVAGGFLGKALGGNKGVGLGVAAGAFTGFAIGSSQWKRSYDQAYYSCIGPRPAYVVQPQPVYIAQPPVIVLPPIGSPNWNYQCSLKYRSFVATGPGTPGYFTGYDYQQRACSLP